jgi:hypothetical protein
MSIETIVILLLIIFILGLIVGVVLTVRHISTNETLWIFVHLTDQV